MGMVLEERKEEKQPESVRFEAPTVTAPQFTPDQRKSAHCQRIHDFYTKIRELTKRPALPAQPITPLFGNRDVLTQAKLILEEMLELMEACGLILTIPIKDGSEYGHSIYRKLLRDEIELVHGKEPDISSLAQDLPHIVKEIADLSVVTTGMFTVLGISDATVLEEVDYNNLAKLGPGGRLNEHGKWIKPPTHPKVDLTNTLKAQGWKGDYEKEPTDKPEETVSVSN